MVVCEAASRYGGLYLSKTKSSAENLNGIKRFLTHIRHIAKDAHPVVDRLHSDAGKEFEGDVSQWALDNLVEKTDTGGRNTLRRTRRWSSYRCG